MARIITVLEYSNSDVDVKKTQDRVDMFLIYMNDLPTVSNIFNILMYADDTTLLYNFDNTQNEFTINNELDNVYRWLCSKKLSLNVSKTKSMCFLTPKRKVIFQD